MARSARAIQYTRKCAGTWATTPRLPTRCRIIPKRGVASTSMATHGTARRLGPTDSPNGEHTSGGALWKLSGGSQPPPTVCEEEEEEEQDPRSR
eukprot:2451267-Pyramimonas_sp.AAC.1